MRTLERWIQPLRVLGLIPARGGSKGLPRKNIAPLAGKPLLYYTAKAARESRNLTRVVLSSEDTQIIAIGRSLGLEVPFVRPDELATDTAPSLAVVQHAIRAVEKEEGRTYDAICLLQPTAPLRTAQDIDTAISTLTDSHADAVISVVLLDEPHPVKTFVLEEGRLHPFLPHRWKETLRRQDLEPVYRLNGAIYCTRREVVVAGSLWGTKTLAYTMPWERSVNIDHAMDLALAELLLNASCPPEA